MTREELLNQLEMACINYRSRLGEDISDQGIMRVLRELEKLAMDEVRIQMANPGLVCVEGYPTFGLTWGNGSK